jgi:hypothetical protein
VHGAGCFVRREDDAHDRRRARTGRVARPSVADAERRTARRAASHRSGCDRPVR